MISATNLISLIRQQTENEDVSDFVGIQDAEFVQYLNDAQYNLQSTIVQQHPRAFMKEVILDAVVDQESYNIPSDCLLGNKVHNVEYSSTGNEEDYYVLTEDTIKSRTSGVTGSPSKYIRLAGKLLLSPEPSSAGKIRINYVQRLRQLDKRRAKVYSAPTISSSGTWTMELSYQDSTGGFFDTDKDDLETEDYICIVDKLGASVVKDIEVAVSGVTNTQLTLEAHTVNTTEGEANDSILAGHYVVGGKHTTTHSDLDESVARYLIAYCAWKILKRDSSVDSTEALQEVQLMQAEIVKSYAMISDDIQFIPVLSDWDDWGV